MLKVAIVGCGKIADSHAAQIQRIKGCEIIGVCDREPLMTQQFCERFRVRKRFSNLQELLQEPQLDVVHITTPPESHFGIAQNCLSSGRHVYLEKPFTLHEKDARALIDLATAKNRKITVGHDFQFSHVARRLRSLVQDGYLGGSPIHMESYYGYELGSSAYTAALLGDKNHWVRQLPGKLLQNVISHGIARIAEYMVTDSPRVLVNGFISSRLKQVGETEIVDELRVILSDDDGCTAYFTFSSQMRPSLYQFRIFGPKNGLILDQDQETLIALRGTKMKSYLEKFIAPLDLAKQYCANVSANVRCFARRDFHMKSGMKYLIESFYSSVCDDAPLPISYRQILLTTRIMDRIFEQLERGNGYDHGEPCAVVSCAVEKV